MPHSLYEFQLSELVKISKATSTCLEEARKTFEARYSHETSYISFEVLDGKHQPQDASHESIIEDIPAYNILNDFNVIKEALSNFGDLIFNLKTDFQYATASNCMDIVKRISKSCTSLKVILLKL